MDITLRDTKECEKLFSLVSKVLGKTDTGECYKRLTEGLRASRKKCLNDWLDGDSDSRTSYARELQEINDALIKLRVYYGKLLLDF